MKAYNIKKTVTLILFYVFGFYSLGVIAQQNNSITIGKTEIIDSNILGEKREIWIYVPQSYQYSRGNYPVVYLLDGNVHFSSVVGMIEYLSGGGSGSRIPEMIVIGIVNTDRTRDLTPTHVDEALPYLSKGEAKTSGGGNAFFNFMEKELMPYIEKNYPTAPYRMLIGHSLGGLMAIDGAINHTTLFNSYVAIDPSLWWDNSKLLNQMKNSLSSKKLNNISLYLAAANTIENGLTIANVRKDTSISNQHIRSILDANDLFNQYKNTNFKYGFKYYSDDNHGSVPFIAEYDAFRFIFDFYNLPLSDEERFNWTMATINKVEKHFAEISKGLGYYIPLPENMVNANGYRLLGQKKYVESEYLFALNIKNFPNSANVYDSMGDYNLAKGETEKAIANFKKALSIDSNFSETKSKLEALLKN